MTQEPQAKAGILSFAAYIMRYCYDADYKAALFAHARRFNQQQNWLDKKRD